MVLHKMAFYAINFLTAIPTKWSNTLNLLANCRQILWVSLIILWGWRLKIKLKSNIFSKNYWNRLFSFPYRAVRSFFTVEPEGTCHSIPFWTPGGSRKGLSVLPSFCLSVYIIFKLTTSIEQNDEKAWFFWYSCRFTEMKSWLKNIGVGVAKDGCGHFGLRTLKLVVSKEVINIVSWFVVCW